ncbi:hypothetical protein SGRA_3677 [Saprospira grandis str. Lewin]|uniref:Uncharacterized protein n=1 Tax=Saprospira grandis (strain Lewin) TaxID=984262 RepID=H6L6W8_SAPGL|nr:hypothetical protein SGRA_3677 [Saprospira grandis str. Lewin]
MSNGETLKYKVFLEKHCFFSSPFAPINRCLLFSAAFSLPPNFLGPLSFLYLIYSIPFCYFIFLGLPPAAGATLQGSQVCSALRPNGLGLRLRRPLSHR